MGGQVGLSLEEFKGLVVHDNVYTVSHKLVLPFHHGFEDHEGL